MPRDCETCLDLALELAKHHKAEHHPEADRSTRVYIRYKVDAKFDQPGGTWHMERVL